MAQRRSGKDKYVVCPYYKWANKGKISCEGVDDESTIHLVYGDENDTYDYFNDYCCSAYGMHRCLIYRMLNRKYGVKDEI